jgi:Flp pilus assembly protein TadD
MAIHHPDRAFDALHRALTLGYPTVEIFNDLGVFWFSLGNRSKSIASFRMALKIPGNHAPPLENMKRMGIEP